MRRIFPTMKTSRRESGLDGSSLKNVSYFFSFSFLTINNSTTTLLRRCVCVCVCVKTSGSGARRKQTTVIPTLFHGFCSKLIALYSSSSSVSSSFLFLIITKRKKKLFYFLSLPLKKTILSFDSRARSYPSPPQNKFSSRELCAWTHLGMCVCFVLVTLHDVHYLAINSSI